MKSTEFITEASRNFVIDPGFTKFYNDDDEDLGRKLVNVKVQAFDKMWKTGPYANQYIGPNGAGNVIKNRYQAFGDWLSKTSEPVFASTVGVDEDGTVSFYNGRHRYAWLRDHGYNVIPMAMDPYSIKNAKKYGII